MTRQFSKEHIRKLKIARNKRTGDKHPRWKGGRNIDSFGYMIVWTPNGMKKEHRMVMELFIRRKLNNNEQVHHINGNKIDNRIENLKLINKREHAQMHSVNNPNKFKIGHKYHGRKNR